MRSGNLGIRSVLTLAIVFGAGQARADADLWIDDTVGNIGMLDLTTKTVSNVVNPGIGGLSDIAFIGSQMYGINGVTFATLYTINITTGAPTTIGAFSGGNGADTGMNALVGFGTVLLGAAFTTDEVYTINPATAGVTNLAPSLFPSAGDLAFSGNTLYESVALPSGLDALVDVTTNKEVGSFGIGNVLGLANVDGVVYAAAGTQVYSVDLSTAALTPVFNYGGLSALTMARGAAAVAENDIGGVPEPSTWIMMVMGFAGLGLTALRQHKRAVGCACDPS